VPRGSTGYRKIHHLRREEKRRRKAKQRDAAGRQLATNLAQGKSDASNGNRGRRGRCLSVEESVRDVHVRSALIHSTYLVTRATAQDSSMRESSRQDRHWRTRLRGRNHMVSTEISSTIDYYRATN
jgi:hypothetical protein